MTKQVSRFVIVYVRTHKRVRQNGILTPKFENTNQADNYIYKRLGNSPYVTIKRVFDYED